MDSTMNSTNTPFMMSNESVVPILKSGKPSFERNVIPIKIPPSEPPDEIIEDDASGNPTKEIIIPIMAIVVLLAVVVIFAARWRYRNKHSTLLNGQLRNNLDNNNKNLRSAEEGIPVSEEALPLKFRNTSTSSASTVGPNSKDDDLHTVTVRVEPEEICKSNRSDICYEINTEQNHSQDIKTAPTPESFITEGENLKKKSSSDISVDSISEREQAQAKKFDLEEVFPKRPKTLPVMTVVEESETNSEEHSKGFPWAEQQWTPDADVIYEDTGSPENSVDLRKERQDCLFPLMGKERFKMKPKGLLERRGSNVALTISLKNEEKSCSSPPPSSRSPKPLVYLRTATAKLDHVQLYNKSTDTTRLQQEFWEVPMNHPSEKHFSIPGYGTKNRYRSILPNPHSRVLLPAAPGGDPLSSYINANYIRGFSSLSDSANRRQSEDYKGDDDRRMSIKRKAAFIATQGPMANTITDFWKMVWRENSTAIVMITKLKERKEKCAEYMPTGMGESHTYENFEIKVKNVRHADHYTVRTIEVHNSEEDDVRVVTHYWYAEWLDHETPDKLRSLLTLVQEVDLRCPDSPNSDHGPVIVHCSAGIGRTGCFIAINIGCRQLRLERKVDPLRIICQLRMDRGGMIQTWEQYQYVHVALSRYARILDGEDVNTPLTGSSIITPDSRGSSKHTTPSSGGEFKSPQMSGRIFSPKSFTKTELATVEETDSAEPKDCLNEGESEQSIFSPRPAAAPAMKSRFSFSCADELPSSASKTVHEPCNDKQTASKDDKHPLTLRTLSPKSRPVRDENWLVNGHCRADESTRKTLNFSPKNCNSDIAKNSQSDSSKGAAPPQSLDLDNTDLGKLEKILSPHDDCGSEVSPTKDNTEKSSVFMFPTEKK